MIISRPPSLVPLNTGPGCAQRKPVGDVDQTLQEVEAWGKVQATRVVSEDGQHGDRVLEVGE